MESDFSVYLDGYQLYKVRDTIDTILCLFQIDDIHQNVGETAIYLANQKGIIRPDDFDYYNEDYPLITASQTVEELRNKLNVLGYGKRGIKVIYDHLHKAMLESNNRNVEMYAGYTNGLEHLVPKAQEAVENLNSLNFDQWYGIASGQLSSSSSMTATANELLNYYEDPLFTLSVLLVDVDESKELVFDLTDLHEYFDDLTFAIDAYDNNTDKAIIITEGTTDIEFLKKSIEILYPYLTRYIRFLETDFKPETNADAILKMAKNFASAGISENMLFILDNDTAGKAAIASFSASARRQLPPSFCISQYPSTELLMDYPTKGPQGDSNLDVNGRAGSIELYLGTDVLSDSDGSLRPIQWRGYNEKMESYQGEVLDKRIIQNNFRNKYREAIASGEVNDIYWSEMKILLRHIFSELSNLPSIYPRQVVDEY